MSVTSMPQNLTVVVRHKPFVSYPVVIADSLSPGWAHRPPFSACTGQAALVYDTRLPSALVASIEAELRTCLGARLVLCAVEGGEATKSLVALTELYQSFSRGGVRRDGLVIALGGGTVGDLAGFAAATWHRGVAWAVLPTTLLAQVDSAVGGKVGVNVRGLKNQVGTFHQPRAVVADVAWLASLPPGVVSSGMGEVLKYALGFDPYLWDLIAHHGGPVLGAERGLFLRIVERCVALKARCVAFDERDRGPRRLLNLGHTFAHMLEGSGACEDHGHAVGLGLVAATRLSVRLGLCDPSIESEVVAVMRTLGMATMLARVPAELDESWRADKKHSRDCTVVVVPTMIGSCRMLADPPLDAVREAFRSLFAAE